MKKNYVLSMVVLSVSLGLLGCSNKTEESDSTISSVESQSKKKESQKKATELSSEKKDVADSSSRETIDFKEATESVKKMTSSSSMTSLYSNQEAQKVDLDMLSVSVDGYELLQLGNINSNFKTPFNNKLDKGGVLLIHYTVNNQGMDELFYTPSFSFTYTGGSKAYTTTTDLLSNDIPNIGKKISNSKFKIEAGQVEAGFIAYAIDQDALKQIQELGTITLEIPEAYRKENSFKIEDKVGEKKFVPLSLTSANESEEEASGELYQDKATVENMGEKKLLTSKGNLKESKEFQDIKVELEGYQFTEFIPNEVEAPRFSAYKNGIILLTSKLSVTNNSSTPIDLSSSSSILNVNDNSEYILSEGMLIQDIGLELLEKGDTKEWIQVFVLDKESYNEIWKDKNFDLNLRLRNSESETLSQGDDLSFTFSK